MKKHCSPRRCFSLITFDMRAMTNKKMTPSCSPRQAGPKHALFDLERSISKFDLRSGQGQIMIQVRSICKSSEAARRVKSFGTICAPLSSSCRDFLAKRRLWPHLTSGDLPWHPIVSCTQIITDGVSGHAPERIGWLRSVYVKKEAFLYFSIGL